MGRRPNPVLVGFDLIGPVSNQGSRNSPLVIVVLILAEGDVVEVGPALSDKDVGVGVAGVLSLVAALDPGAREHVQRFLVGGVVVVRPRRLARRQFVETAAELVAARCFSQLLAAHAHLLVSDVGPVEVGLVHEGHEPRYGAT